MNCFNTSNTDKVLRDVLDERERQVDLGMAGKIPHACEDPDTHWGYRLGVLGEEYGEVCTDVIECPPEAKPRGNIYKELIQTAAVAVACAESLVELDTREWEPVIAKIPHEPTPENLMKDIGIDPARQAGLRRQASLSEHRAVLERAMKIYEQREDKYQGIWREYGWRGSLMQARSCVERAWRTLWNAEPRHNETVKTDDLVDLINYVVFTIRNIEDGNRDGTWGYPNEQ